MLLHQVIDSLDRIINDGIIIYKLLLPRNWTFDLGLNFPYQVSSSCVHRIGPHRSLEFLVPSGFVADDPFLPLETDRSQADSVPMNPFAFEEN